MYHVSANTLAYAKGFIGLKPMDMSDVLLPSVSEGIIKYRKALTTGEDGLVGEPISQACVELEAIRFYMHNHVFAMLCAKHGTHEVLCPVTAALANAYPRLLSDAGRRLVSYTLMVIVREARHLSESNDFQHKLESKFGKTFRDWRAAIPSSSTAAAEYLLTNPVALPIGKVCKGLTYVFNKGSFSGGYGGKPWGNIAHTLEKYFTGVISLEAFIDTAWTLAHNNGPMFNKGMLYDSYGGDLLTLLDVQASGQIPNMVNDVIAGDYTISKTESHITALKDMMTSITMVLPEVADWYVDWQQVEDLGLHSNSYGHMKSIQHNKHGLPPAEQAAIDAAEAAVKAEQDAKFYIAPGLFATKIPRAA